MDFAIKVLVWIVSMFIYLIFKLGLVIPTIYVILVTTVWSDWLHASQLNEVLATIGFGIICLGCVVNWFMRIRNYLHGSYVPSR